MKRWICILLCMALLPLPVLAESESYTAYVDGKTSDRVHLRKAASAQSASLGLFFTGTPVVCYSSLDEMWAEVQIGTQKGYMMSKYLTTADSGVFEMVGTVKNIKTTTALKVRKKPTTDASAVCTVRLNDQVRVLGETKDQWCYIRVGAERGYIKSQYLAMEAVWHAGENMAGAPTIDLKDPYMPILHKYYLALLERWEWGKLLDYDLSEMCDFGYSSSNPMTLAGYMLEDMNDDGLPELLIGSLSGEHDKYMLFEMYVLEKEKPISVVRSWARSRFYLCENNVIGHEGANSAASGLDALMYLADNNELDYIEVTIIEGDFSPDAPYWQSDTYEYGHPSGTKLTKEEFVENLRRYESLRIQYPLTPFSTLQGTVGRIHVDGSISGDTTVNIRDQAAKTGKVLAAPKTGTTVSVLSKIENWYEVYCDGVHGYIMAEFVSVY